MSLDLAREPNKFGWRRPRPLGEDGPLPRDRPLHAGLFAALTGPPIGTLALLAGGVAGTIGPGGPWAAASSEPDILNIVSVVIFIIPLAYVFFVVPAFVGGALYGAWSRRAPGTIAALAAAPLLGGAVAGGFTALLSLVEAGWLAWSMHVPLYAAIGAVAGFGCALWLEYLWRRPEATRWQRFGNWGALVVVGLVAIAPWLDTTV
jgi:hypothetical protein